MSVLEEILKLSEKIKSMPPHEREALNKLFEGRNTESVSFPDITNEEALPSVDLEKELTILIPTFNSAGTVKKALDSLMTQGFRPKIVVYDNGSTDGTIELIEAMLRNRYYKEADILFKKTNQVPGGKNKNVCFMRYKLTELVETEFMFFLDSDIVLPAGVLKPLLTELKKFKNLGMLGLRYEQNPSHVKMGATALRTELAKKVKYVWDERACECIHAGKEIRSMGYDVAYFNFRGGMAVHLKERRN